MLVCAQGAGTATTAHKTAAVVLTSAVLLEAFVMFLACLSTLIKK